MREAFTRLIQSDLQLHTGFCVRSGAENGFWGKLGGPEGRPEARPADGLAVDFVVESDRAQTE